MLKAEETWYLQVKVIDSFPEEEFMEWFQEEPAAALQALLAKKNLEHTDKSPTYLKRSWGFRYISSWVTLRVWLYFIHRMVYIWVYIYICCCHSLLVILLQPIQLPTSESYLGASSRTAIHRYEILWFSKSWERNEGIVAAAAAATRSKCMAFGDDDQFPEEYDETMTRTCWKKR